MTKPMQAHRHRSQEPTASEFRRIRQTHSCLQRQRKVTLTDPPWKAPINGEVKTSEESTGDV